MSQTKTIIINFVATYGRSLYALVIGLFCGRWTFLSLGETDYGLAGVVGGMTAFVSYFNGLLAMGVGRFYALNVGLSRRDPEGGLLQCRQWFTTAVLVHTVVPMMLMIVGYPIGEWAVRSFLTIPADRVSACVWVWRFCCCSCFVTMISVPFSAMYGAKQEIAELTIYSFVTTTLNFLFLSYMITHPGDWLVRYMLWSCVLVIVPKVIICVRSYYKYAECRFNWRYVRCLDRLKMMCSYIGWLMIGGVADLLQGQGVEVVVNRFLGPSANAAVTVANSYSGHSTTLANNLSGAFWPAIYNAWGEGRRDLAKSMAMRMSRIATLFTLLFVVPMIMESDVVLKLWLKMPPAYAATYAAIILVWVVLDKMTFGYTAIMHAANELKTMQISAGIVTLSCVPLCCLVLWNGCGILGVAFAVAGTAACARLIRVVIGRIKLGMAMFTWIRHIAFPSLVLYVVGVLIGCLIRYNFEPGLIRIFISTCAIDVVILPLGWFLLIGAEERAFVVERIRRIFKRM